MPDDVAVRRCLVALDRQGGTLTLPALAQQANILPLRLNRFLAKRQRLLNVDGYEVLLVDRVQTGDFKPGLSAVSYMQKNTRRKVFL